MAAVRRVVRRDSRPQTDLTEVTSWVRQFVTVKAQQAALQERYGDLKRRLEDVIDRLGYEDDKGHRYFDLPEDVEGVVRVQRRRRVSTSLDDEAALALVESKGLPRERFVKTIEVFDEEEILKAHYEGVISEDEIDALTTTNVSWALYTQTE